MPAARHGSTPPTTVPPGAVDAVVIGAGPNGLTAAARLARAGRSVAVFEARPNVGGGCRTAELIRPGVHHDVCAAVFPLGVLSPAFAALGLHDRIGWLRPTIPLAHPLDGRPAALLHSSPDATAEGLGSAGTAWRRALGPLLTHHDTLLTELLDPPLSLLQPGLRQPLLHTRLALRLALPATVTARRLGDSAAAALFAGCAAHAFLPLTRPFTSAFGHLLAATAHTTGWPLAGGGAQRIVDELAADVVRHGGTIHTDTLIGSLADLPPHRVALFDTSPRALATIAGSALPAPFRRRLQRFRHGPAAFKVDLELDGPIPWTDPSCADAGTLHLGGTLDEIAQAEHDIWHDRMPERPFTLVVQSSAVDPTRAPDGTHVVWTYAHVPHGWTGDATEAVLGQLERFAPGVRDRIVGRHVMGPLDFAAYNPNDIGGDISGGAHDGAQLLARPVFGRPYRTPNERIWLCSASTPPGGGVHGMAGWHAAGRVLDGPLR